jgi:hypothetical protein
VERDDPEMRICYEPEVDAVYARVAEPTGPARTEVLESGVAVERSAEADGGAYGFEFIMVKSRGLPTIDLPSDVALAIEEFVASGALESRDKQQQITPTRLLLIPRISRTTAARLGHSSALRGRSTSSQSGSVNGLAKEAAASGNGRLCADLRGCVDTRRILRGSERCR